VSEADVVSEADTVSEPPFVRGPEHPAPRTTRAKTAIQAVSPFIESMTYREKIAITQGDRCAVIQSTTTTFRVASNRSP
jgi:hypothetical protein